ncbi:MAG: LytTR family transcriptional regulator DNA-binding domain-containing protein [Gammaproteobacteria bacterium]|nr:LytTR family transcriptional regulator DNA-binding domain-containing protein [Gammaproteobacteria bacterium]MDG2338095.1 LytTR family transcriptional regulator DNA-binding domain-containing protein [Gammaproteobacteria bacterium]
MTGNDTNILKAIIVDDEELARQGLEMRLSAIENVQIVKSCANAKEALQAIAELEHDLVFLDIQMPGKTGLEMIGEIQADILPMIVFVTAYDSFAVDAFKIHAIDYLLKPVENERLLEAVAKARQHKLQVDAAREKQRLLNLLVSLTGKSFAAISELSEGEDQSVEHADRLAIKDGSSITFVRIKDIDWVDAAGDYMCVHVAGATHIMRTTMKELESKLDPAIFQRVHRSTIVNLRRVEKVSSHINGEFHLTLSCGSSLKMSRSYKEKIKHFF